MPLRGGNRGLWKTIFTYYELMGGRFASRLSISRSTKCKDLASKLTFFRPAIRIGQILSRPAYRPVQVGSSQIPGLYFRRLRKSEFESRHFVGPRQTHQPESPGLAMTNIKFSEPAIDADHLQLMLQLGVPPTYIRTLLSKDSHAIRSPYTSGNVRTCNELSTSEMEILKAGGASGVGDRSSDARTIEHAVLDDLIRECRDLVTQSYSLAEVAEMLQISTSQAEALATQAVPRLYAFQLGDGSLRFPGWQFIASSTIPTLEPLLAVTGAAINPLVISRFMLTENGDLVFGAKPLSPRHWLVKGLCPDPVLRLMQGLKGN